MTTHDSGQDPDDIPHGGSPAYESSGQAPSKAHPEDQANPEDDPGTARSTDTGAPGERDPDEPAPHDLDPDELNPDELRDEPLERFSGRHLVTAVVAGVLVAGVILAGIAVVLLNREQPSTTADASPSEARPASTAPPAGSRYQAVDYLCEHVDAGPVGAKGSVFETGGAFECVHVFGKLTKREHQGTPLIEPDATLVVTVWLRDNPDDARALLRKHLDSAPVERATEGPEPVEGLGQEAFRYVTDELSEVHAADLLPERATVVALVVQDANLYLVLEYKACSCQGPSKLRKARNALREVARTTLDSLAG